MKIRIDKLEELTISLFDKIKKEIGNEIELNNDYYWDISKNELYNPYEEPKVFTLGQLSFDIDELNNRNNSDAANYDLKLISNIIKAISIEYPV